MSSSLKLKGQVTKTHNALFLYLCVTQMHFVPKNLLWVMHKFNTHAQDMSTKAEQAAWGLSPTLALVAGTLRYHHETMEGG